MSKYQQFYKMLDSAQIIPNANMKEHTSFKIGGLCDLLILPKTETEILKAIEICKKNDLPYYVMGNGSNLLVKDKGFKGVIIKISNALSNISVHNELIFAQAGVSLSSLANIAKKYSLTGFEFASGIPGTLGGAICMNAGAYDGEIKNVLKTAKVLSEDGNIKELTPTQLELGYRTSIIPKMGYIVLSAELALKKGTYDEIFAKMNEFNTSRRTKQPLELPSAGSTFKRPEGHFAGKLIMDCNLAGYSVGGAQVSAKHCGFVVNSGNATADDVLKLIDIIKERVYKTFNVSLEPEIKIIGE